MIIQSDSGWQQGAAWHTVTQAGDSDRDSRLGFRLTGLSRTVTAAGPGPELARLETSESEPARPGAAAARGPVVMVTVRLRPRPASGQSLRLTPAAARLGTEPENHWHVTLPAMTRCSGSRVAPARPGRPGHGGRGRGGGAEPSRITRAAGPAHIGHRRDQLLAPARAGPGRLGSCSHSELPDGSVRLGPSRACLSPARRRGAPARARVRVASESVSVAGGRSLTSRAG